MSNAIEVLKQMQGLYGKKTLFYNAIDEALLALEQINRIKAYLKYRMKTSNRTADKEMAYVVEYETLEELVKECKIKLEEGVSK